MTSSADPAQATRVRIPRDGFAGLRGVVWFLLALLVLVPLAMVLRQGVRPENVGVIMSPDVRDALVNSVASAGGSALLATAVGAVLAICIERTDLPARTALRWLVLLPFLIPPFIGAMAWIALLGPNGPANRVLKRLLGPDAPVVSIFGGWGVVLLLTVHSYPFAFLVIAAALRRVPASLEEAARINGAGTWRTLRDVTLPLLRPGLLAALMLTFVANMSDFGIPALIGLPERYTTLTTLVYRYLASGTVTNPLPAVSAIGVVLLIVALAAVVLQRRFASSVQFDGGSFAAAPLQLGRPRHLIGAVLWLVAGAVCLLPLLALAAQALLPAPGVPLTLETVTLENIVDAVSSRGARRGFGNSMILATGAAVICAVLGLAVAALLVRTRHRGNAALDVTVLLPQALPGLVVAVAWLLVAPLLGIFNTPWLILGAYVTAFLALVVQAVRAPLQSVPASLEDAARVSGAGPVRALSDVAIRLAAPAALTGGVVVLLTAVRELTISILLVAPGTQTLGVVIFNLQQAGDYNAASALALVVALGGIVGLSVTAAVSGRATRLQRKGT